MSERTRPSTSQSVRGRLSAASRPGRTYGWVR